MGLEPWESGRCPICVSSSPVPQERPAARPRLSFSNRAGRSARSSIAGISGPKTYSRESSGDFDAEPGLSRVKTKVLAVNFVDDEFYRDNLQTLERDIRAVRGGRSVVRAVSDGSVGHMSMCPSGSWADQARDFVAWLNAR
jgi:hypothetical protein